MTPGFTVFQDVTGDLWVADGWIVQPRTGARVPVGSGAAMGRLLRAAEGARFREIGAASGATLAGGSGRGLASTGLPPAGSGPEPPVGLWLARAPNEWTLGIFTLTVTGASAAKIRDGTGIVATLSTGGTAPVGNFSGTTYGRTTYNGGTAFTIATVAEQGWPGTLPDYELSVSAGTAQAGIYTPTDATHYESADDADWTVAVASDGSAELLYLGTLIAAREVAAKDEPGGSYEANEDGTNDYNGGAPWRAFLRPIQVPTRAGFVYVTATETGGVLKGASGPFLATALPAASIGVCHFPIAVSDGLGGIEQLHTGALVFPDTEVAAGMMANTYNCWSPYGQWRGHANGGGSFGTNGYTVIYACRHGTGLATAWARVVISSDTTATQVSIDQDLCAVPLAVSLVGCFYTGLSGANGGKLRITVGDSDAAGTPPPLGNAAALSARGFGAECYWSTANSRNEIRLFAHNGTTLVYGTAIAFDGSWTKVSHLIIASDGAGRINLYLAESVSGVLARPTLQTTASIATGGPTSGSYGQTGAVTVASVAHGVNVPTGDSFYVHKTSMLALNTSL